MEETLALSNAEQRVLRNFRRFLMTPGQMLCFCGPNLKQNRATLQQLSDRGLLIKEDFEGGYSLTRDGFAAMKSCKN